MVEPVLVGLGLPLLLLLSPTIGCAGPLECLGMVGSMVMFLGMMCWAMPAARAMP